MPVNSFENYPMSWKPDKRLLKSPLYFLASSLEYDILNGYLLPNTKLPPQRELADYLDINLSTVTRAFKICEVKGLIYAVIGSGTFVAPKGGNAIFIAYDDTNKSYIDMSVIKPLDCCNALVTEAIKSIANKNYLEKLLNYEHHLGIPYHRMAAKRWMQGSNMDIPIDNIAITSGGQNSLTLILISLFDPGDKIAVDTYTYPNFIELANMLNIQLIPIGADVRGMLPERLDAACNKNNIKGIYLHPSCSNPTAVILDMERRVEMAEVIKKHKLILIEGDSYSFLAPQGYLPISHFVPEQFVYSLSTSKSLCSGIRVGFIAYANQFAKKINRGIININVKTSSLNGEIITELINTGIADKIIAQKKEIVKERNALYQQYFKVENPNENPLSFFRWVPLSKKYQPKQFEQDALAHGIRLYHSYRFLTGKDEPSQFIRISLTSVKDSVELDKGLCLLKSLLND
jgi:DNA-binding transcriptional MocR family regulator